MNKSTKFLGVVLILVTATCLVAGGVNLSSTLNDKNYWENKGAKATADLDTLEAGLNTLKSNQKAYEDGRIAYQTGLADYQKGQDDLKKGQEEYDAGLATLNSKQLEYDAGLAELQAAEQQLAAGKQTLDENYQAYIDGKAQIAQYEQGQRDYKQGLADYNAGQANVKNGTAALIAAASANAGYDLGTLDAAEQYVAASETKLKQVQPIVETAGSGILSIKSDYEKWQSDYAKISPFQSKTSSNLPLSNSTKDEYLQAVSSEANADALKTLINRLLTKMPNIASRASTALWNGINFENDVIAELDREGLNGSQAMNAILNYLFGVPSSDADGFQAAMNKIAVVSNATINLYYNGTRDVAAFNAGEAELNTGKAQLAAAEPQLAAAKQTLDANYAAYVAGKAKIAEYEQGLAEYNAGLAEYNEGKAKLDDGAAQLAAGREQLDEAADAIENGKVQLADAEKQLDDGKAQLAEFETGRDQAIDGIELALATETYGDLESIADRVGSNFKYVSDNGDLDITKGLFAVQTARDFTSDNTAAVTRDLTGRTIAAVATLIAGALALIVSIILLRKA